MGAGGTLPSVAICRYRVHVRDRAARRGYRFPI